MTDTLEIAMLEVEAYKRGFEDGRLEVMREIVSFSKREVELSYVLTGKELLYKIMVECLKKKE